MASTSGFTENIDKEMDTANPIPIENLFTHISEYYISESGHTRLFTAVKYGKRYMLKCLKPDFLYIPIYRQALSKEFEIGLQLEHPYICRTIGLEQVPGLGNCIVMEYVDGDTLQTLMDKKKLTPGLAHKITTELMHALEYMHNKQIVHRDLKPSNIMVTHNGQNVKLIDFGLSDSDSFTVLKLPAGTSGYIAPEQLLEGARSEPRADIYSLGMVIKDMANATGDRYLKKMAEVCACRDLRHRPASIEQLRQYSFSDSCSLRLVVVLGVICLIFALLIGCHYYLKRGNRTSESHPKEKFENDSSLIKGENQVKDYQLWDK